MYTGFAEVYDTLMNDVHYGAWADMYARMMTAYGIPRNAKVCECACGTGSLTLPLQQLGYEMMGIDLSQEMLWQAANSLFRRFPLRNPVWVGFGSNGKVTEFSIGKSSENAEKSG